MHTLVHRITSRPHAGYNGTCATDGLIAILTHLYSVVATVDPRLNAVPLLAYAGWNYGKAGILFSSAKLAWYCPFALQLHR